MSDFPGAPRPHNPGGGSGMGTGLGDDARRPGAQAGAQAGAALDEAGREAGALARDAKREGEGLLNAARGQAEEAVEEGKAQGAETVSAVARAIHRIAEDLDEGAPELGRRVHDAAEAADGIARALRERSFGELMGDAGDFARRNPTAFFALSAVAGFVLVRFVRSGAPHGTSHARAAAPVPPGRAPGWVGDDRSARPATMAAASLGGAAAHRPGQGAPGSMPAPRDPVSRPPVGGVGGQGAAPLPGQRPL